MLYTNREIRVRFPRDVNITRAWLDADPERAQRVLRSHYSERPVCSCVPAGVEMHIVYRQGTYYLASMPGRAHHHALYCPYYIPHPSTDALQHYADTAYSRKSGNVHLRVLPEKPSGTPFAHFSPRAALEHFWQLAGLNVYAPAPAPAPTLPFVAKSLSRIASRVRINGEPFAPHTPPVAQGDAQPTHVIGLARFLSPTRYGYRLVLSRDRGKQCFWISEETWLRAELSNQPQLVGKPVGCPYLVVGRIWRSKRGHWNLVDLGILEIEDNFIPVHGHTRSCIADLVHHGRRFFACAQLDTNDSCGMPAAVLLDTETPTPVYNAATGPGLRSGGASIQA